MARTTKDKLTELLEKESQIKAQIQALKQRESEAARKKDSRRKILIGGAVLAKVKRGEWHMNQLQDLLNSELKADRDRELFDLPSLNQNQASEAPSGTGGGNQP